MATASSNPSPSPSPPTTHPSPRGQRRRGGAVASPWTQVVRGGGESEPIAAVVTGAPSSPTSSSGAVTNEQLVNPSDWSPTKLIVPAAAEAPLASSEDTTVIESGLQEGSDNGGSGGGNKPAWKKPTNGAPVEVGHVMGGSWPALSESARASPKSLSSDSLKNLPDGSVSVPQGTGMPSPSSHKQVTSSNANLTSTPNHVAPTRQRSFKRGGGNTSNNLSANGGISQPPHPQVSMVETAPTNSGKPGSSSAESSSRENTHREGGHRGGTGPQSHSGNEHQQHRSSFRRGNGGSQPRGDGSYHHGYGGRRDQDRGNQEWSHHRRQGGSDSHMQPRGPSRQYVRGPPHTTTPFMPPPPVHVRPFGAPIVYPELQSPLYYVPGPHPDPLRMPMISPVAPMYFPVPDPQLHTKILTQIEYYFSNENLIKDTFLRKNMDNEGWVPLQLIAGFQKVMQLTSDIQIIMDALRTSSVVEVQVQECKVRRRNDWARWIMPPSVQYPSVSSPQSLQKSGGDMLAAHLQSVTLDEKTINYAHAEPYLSRSSSGELSSQSQQSGGEMTGHSTSGASASK